MSGKKKKETYIQSLEGLTRKHSQWRDVIHRLFKNRLAIVGLPFSLPLYLQTF